MPTNIFLDETNIQNTLKEINNLFINTPLKLNYYEHAEIKKMWNNTKKAILECIAGIKRFYN